MTVATLQTQVNVLEGKIDNLATRISSLEAKVTALISAPNAPPAPVVLVAGAVTSNSIFLDWGDAPPTGLISYTVYRSTNDNAFIPIGPFTGSPPSSNLLDSGLNAATKYTYFVVSTNSFGTSAPSNVVTRTTTGADTTPDQFTFVDQTNVALNTVITSAPITVTGINAAAVISVSAGSSYSINGGAFTSASGTVNNNDQVRARHTSSAANSTPVDTVITIGGVSDTFTSTTIAVAGTTVASFTLTSPLNINAPFTIGHAFRQTDIPGGSFITTDIGNCQADVRNLWPDGSVKYAVLSGRTLLTANVPTTIVVQRNTSALGGSNITEPSPSFLGANIALTIGGTTYTPQQAALNGSVTWNKATPAKMRQILGPAMSEFHYYVPATDPYLSIWWYVRVYPSSFYEVETVVENSWIALTGAAKTYTASLSIAGSTVYTSGTLTHYHHTRWSRVDWIGGDPEVTPKHDTAYLRSTKLVPNYGYNSPTAAGLNALLATTKNPAPFALGDWNANMGDFGAQAAIGPLPRWEAMYCGSADPKTYTATVGNQRGSGRWSMHMRDDQTGRPALYESFPNMSFSQGWGSPDLTNASSGGSAGVYDIAHHPSQGFLPYLIEGRWTFVESIQMTAIFCLMSSNTASRIANGSTGLLVIGSPLTTRGLAWSVRTMAQAAAITPTYLNGVAVSGADIMQSQLRKSIDDTATYHYGRYITGTIGGTIGVNSIGYIGHYGGDGQTNADGNYWGRNWMWDFQVIAFGLASDLGIEGQTKVAEFTAVRDHLYNQVVRRLGDNTTWNFRRAAIYDIPLLNAGGSLLTTVQSYAAYKAANGLGDITANSGDFLTTGGNTAMVNDDSSELAGNGYWAIVLAAISYAKTHQKSGADNAYALMTAAPNFTPSAMGMDDSPEFGLISTVSSSTALSAAASALIAGSGAVASSHADFGTGPNWGADTFAISWCTGTLYYDATRRTVHIGGGFVATEQKHHHIYDEVSNTWGANTLATPYPAGTISGHFWNTNFAPEWGDYFFNPSGATTYRYSNGAWSTINWGSNPGDCGLGWHPNLFGVGDGGLVFNTQQFVKAWRRSTGIISTLASGYDVGGSYNGGSGAYNSSSGKLWIGTGNTDRCWSIASGSGGTPGAATHIANPPVTVIGSDDPSHVGKVIPHPYTAGKLLCLVSDSSTVYESTNDGTSWTTAAYTHPFYDNTHTKATWWSPGTISAYGIIWSIRSVAGSHNSIIWKPPA